MVERDAPAMPLPAVLAFDLGGTRIKAGIIRGATVSSLLIEATNDGRDGADVPASLLRLGRRLGAVLGTSTTLPPSG
jgi:glucokinase